MIWRRFILPAVVALLTGLGGLAQAQQTGLTDSSGAAAIDVIRAEGSRLRVDIKVSGGARLDEVKATLNGEALKQLSLQPYPSTEDTSVVLFVVDAGEAARQPVVDQMVAQIAVMLRAAQPYQHFGLATFDGDLNVLVPPGADAATVLAALPRVRAGATTTELYRGIVTGITRVAISPATRRAVFLFADGATQDTAYKFEDAVAAGKASDVAVYTFGFMRPPTAAPPLPSLRKLAEETGGRYYAASADNILPAAALIEPFEALDSGGRAYFDLSPAQFAAGGAVNVQVNMSNGGASLDVVLPGLPPPPIRGWQLWIRQPINQASLGLGVVFALGLMALALDRHARRHAAYLKRLAAGHFEEPEAWLEVLEGDGTHIGVTGNLFRIGRNRDNDLTLNDASIAPYHATIQRAANGSYSVADLRTGKGVSVNLTQVTLAPLHNGDMVELGRVRFRFRATARGLPEHGVSGEAALAPGEA